MTNIPKRLVIVADDYGISPSVSLGIRELALKGRISATGAMTAMPSWPGEAPALKDLPSGFGVGLHFTLTDQPPLGPMPGLAPRGVLPPVGELVKRSLLGAIPVAEVEAELQRQLDAFEAALGRPPDFLDGHQHVHVLRGVRETVLDAFASRLDRRRCWLRDCRDRPFALLARPLPAKALLVALLARRAGRAARERDLLANRGFSGFYDARRQDIRATFPALLAGAGDGHLLMMHPGHVDEELVRVDPLVGPRQAEWEFLASDGFVKRLAELGFALTPRPDPWQTPPP